MTTIITPGNQATTGRRAKAAKPRGMGRVFQPRYRDKQTREWRTAATWWIEYCHRGKQHRESSGSTKPSVAKALLKQRLGEISTGRFLGPEVEKTTFDDLAAMLLNDFRINGKRSLGRLEDAVNHLRAFFGGTLAVDIKTDRVLAYVALRQAERPGNIKRTDSPRTTSSGTINRELTALKRMFRLGLRAERVARCPYIPLLDEANTRIGFFERDHFDALLAQLPAQVRPPMEFAYLTGWRMGEVLSLTWAQVDFSAGTVRLEPGTTKTGEGRAFPFAVLPRLGDLLRVQRAYTSTIERARGRIIPWVFHRDGEPIRSFRSAWKGACRRAGLVGRVPHDFRRTAVRNMERAGVPRSVAMKLVGHRTESVYRRYAIVSEADLSEGVAKLAALHAAQATATRTVIPLAAAGARAEK